MTDSLKKSFIAIKPISCDTASDVNDYISHDIPRRIIWQMFLIIK